MGVPVYNGERFLPGLFANLAAQTFGDFEIVVSDNASTDATPRIVAEWAARDPRIRYHRNPVNIGASGNFNKVFELSRAPLFKWAACDDTFAPGYLEACVRLLERNPDAILAQTEVICVDGNGTPFERERETGHYIIPGTSLTCRIDPIDLGESSVAARRYYDVLFRCRSNSQIFGVFRREALARTRLLADFLGAEKATVLEAALLGRFVQDREQMFYRSYHPDITEAKIDDEGRAYISNRRESYSRPARMFSTFLRTPLGKPVGPATIAACYGLLVVRGLWFVSRPLFQSEARSWPFRTAWGNARKSSITPR